MPFPLFLAFRYLKPDRSLYAIIRMLSLLGIALGVMILIVTMAIMTGFGEMWREKLMEFHSHVSVQGHQLSEWDETVQKKIKDTPGVTAISPAIYTRVMIKRDGFTAAPAIKGIDPFLEGDTSTIGIKSVRVRCSAKRDLPISPKRKCCSAAFSQKISAWCPATHSTCILRPGSEMQTSFVCRRK